MYIAVVNYGNIAVRTDKSTYFGGDTVTGTVHLDLFLPYPGNKLFLKLVGKENVHVVNQRTEYRAYGNIRETNIIDELFEETHEIIKMITPIYTWTTLNPGQYSIPFAFMLPSTLPSSFHQEGNRYIADISYKIEAILEPFFKTEPRLKDKQVFIVRQPIKSAMQGVGNESRVKLNDCFCLDKGTNTLRVKFEKNFYSPGEIAQVIMQLDNIDSQLDNTSITFCLKQRFMCFARGRFINKDYVKISRTLPGIPAGGVSEASLIALNLPGFQASDYSKSKNKNLLHHLLHLYEDHSILNSATMGKLIASEYFLEVSCPMYSTCGLGSPAPFISCPIEIYYPEIQLEQLSLPPNWNPQEIECVNVSFNAGVPIMNTNINMNGMNGTQINFANQMPQGNVQMNSNMVMPNMNVNTTTTTSNSQNHQSFGQQNNVQMNVNMGMPSMNVAQTSNSTQNNQYVGMNMGYGGMQVQQNAAINNQNTNMNVNMGFGMPGMNMNVNSHTTSNGQF